MKLKAIVHEVEEGGYWAEVPALPGCATWGRTFAELLSNIHKAVEGCLSVYGWEQKRINGSHNIYVKHGYNIRISSPCTATFH